MTSATTPSEGVSAALAVYGSLAPGEPNHWVVSRIEGEWVQGTVHGYVFEVTWGPADGYQGFIADPQGSAVEVSVLRSTQLEKKWREIDEFEGPGYDRLPIPVWLDDGTIIEADIYIARTEND